MRWLLTVPGQPWSWNQSHHIVQLSRRGMGRAGQFRTIAKTEEAIAYTQLVKHLASTARPPGWQPQGFVVIEYYYFLGRWVDADNVMKLVDDGLKAALGVDDRWFLPRAMAMETGLRPHRRRVELVIGNLSDFESRSPEVDSSTLLRITSSTSSPTEPPATPATQLSFFDEVSELALASSSGWSPSGAASSAIPTSAGSSPTPTADAAPSSTETARWWANQISSSPSSHRASR